MQSGTNENKPLIIFVLFLMIKYYLPESLPINIWLKINIFNNWEVIK